MEDLLYVFILFCIFFAESLLFNIFLGYVFVISLFNSPNYKQPCNYLTTNTTKNHKFHTMT